MRPNVMIHLLNHYEKVTYERLKPVCERNAATVFAKVRLKDALPVENSGITNEDFKFSLQSHFDFLVVDRDAKPLFAVEYDGRQHAQPEQRARDHRKNALCERFELGLLRINSRYMDRRYRELDLLTYFVDVWFMNDAFSKAQHAGEVPWDEDFDPWLVLSDPNSKKRFPYWISAEAQISLQRLGEKRVIAEGIPSHYVGVDSDKTYRCLVWIKIATDRYAVVKTGMRAQHFPVVLSDLLSQIGTCDLAERVKRILNGKAHAISESELTAQLQQFERDFEMRSRAGLAQYASR